MAQLPPTGIELTVAPLKLGGGSGGPARVFAVTGVQKKHGHRRDKSCLIISKSSYLFTRTVELGLG